MKMARDAGAGTAAEVHAEIVAFGLVRGGKGELNSARELHHFREHICLACGKVREVSVRNDHDVTGGVGKAIENYKILFGAENNQGIGVVAESEKVAEDAAVIFGGVGDVVETPRSP